MATAEKVPRSGIKGQDNSETRCIFGSEGLHYDGAASRFTCALFYCSSDKAHTACVILAILQVNDLKRPRGQEK